MNPILEDIKAECRKVLELVARASDGPWEDKYGNLEVTNRVAEIDWCVAQFASPHDRSFIAHSRTFTPFAAQAMLDSIAGWEELRICTCDRPTKILPDGGVMAPGDHTEDCIMWFRNFQLKSICDAWEARKKQP